MRKMGLDYGDVRIGIALSDLMGIIANAYESYTRKTLSEDLNYLAELAKSQNVDTIVIGLPINMDGTHGDRVTKTQEFAEQLKNVTDAKIKFMDERLSSLSAEKILIEADVRREKRKQVIDKVAASIILQNYLDIYSK